MALNQTSKLVWIVETIYRARKISFEELNRCLMNNVDLSGGEEMLKRTFHKWNLFDTFCLPARPLCDAVMCKAIYLRDLPLHES